MDLMKKRHPSVMKHDFSTVPHADIPRSSFRRSHGLKTAFDSAYLIPIYADEALPGDTFKLNMSSMARLATPLLPFMDNVNMDFFFFSVPNRLLWDNWQKFMGEQTNPGDSVDFNVPQVPTVAGGFTLASLADYMGLPIGKHPLSVNSLHFRAYNLIWNEWFRDQNLQNSVTVDKDDGPDTMSDYVLLKRGKRHDYFTSSLPWPQKGAGVELPLGTSAPLSEPSVNCYGSGKNLGVMGGSTGTQTGGLFVDGGGNLDASQTEYGQDLGTGGAASAMQANYVLGVTTSGANSGLRADLSSVVADLSEATAATINSLREAFQLQKLFERDARGGSRYTEIIKSHFRVDSPDSRMQRPEYLGGGSTPLMVTPIPQTSEAGTTQQGHLTAVAFQQASGIGFTKSFVEHSVIIGMVCVRADLTYQQGLNRMWSRQTKYDYYWPALAHLGEQEVLNKEIFTQAVAADDLVFGYQERWAEYRYKPSHITGILRSDAAGSLDIWHLSQDFAALPVLNSDFIEENPPISRVVAVPSEPEFIFDGYFDITCTRPMPMYSVPGLIDHF